MRVWLAKVYDVWMNNEKIIRPYFHYNTPDAFALFHLPLIDFMDGEFAITSELTAIPTPGHTPGHVSIQINSQGEKALILGDVLHNTAQLQELDWSSRADIDPDIARVTRRSVVETMENEDYVVLAGHLPSPGFGKILRLNGVRYWQGIEGF